MVYGRTRLSLTRHFQAFGECHLRATVEEVVEASKLVGHRWRNELLLDMPALQGQMDGR